jgi:hypothetical protein
MPKLKYITAQIYVKHNTLWVKIMLLTQIVM